MTEAWADLELSIASAGGSSSSSLDSYYDTWARGELSARETRMLMCAPPEPQTQLLWWQWVERCRGIEAHDPPVFQPEFMKRRAPEAPGESDTRTKDAACWLYCAE